MATKKTIEIDLNISEAQKSLDKFGGTLEDVKGEGVQPLNFAIGELEDRLYEMAAAGDTSSKEFKEMSAEVGKMKKVIIDVDMAVDGMSQTLTQNVGGALSGVASGFELAQGAMGAFGAGGEAVEEALLKVQSAMAISQGLQGIRESIASFKALRKAVMANVVVQKLLNFVMTLNPIGLIIAGVVALGAAIALLWKPIQKLGGFFEGITKKLGMFGQLMKWTLAVVFWPFILAVKASMAVLKSLGLVESDEEKAGKARHAKRMTQINERIKKEKELRDKLKKEYEAEQENLDWLIKLAEAQGKSSEELTKQKIQDSINYQKEQLKEIENSIKAAEFVASKMSGVYKDMLDEKLEKEREALKESQKAIKEGEQSLILMDIESNQKKADNYKNRVQSELDAKRRIEDLKLELLEEGEEKEIAARKLRFERELEDTKLHGDAKAEEIKLQEDLLRQDILAIKAKYRPEELELRNAEVLGNQEKNRQILKDDRATAEEKKRIAKEETRAKMQEAGRQYESATQGLQMIADFAKVIAGKNEKAQKVAFNIQKAASIAQATIDTYKNATAAYGSFASIPVVGVPLGIAAAAAAVAAGIANVRSIASTKFEGGGGGSPSTPSAPSIGGGGGGGGSSPAQFNVVGGTGVNQLAESLGGQDKVVKSYVVSGDVTTAQSLDRNRIDTASI